MVVNREKKTIEMVLEDGARHTTRAADPVLYETVRFDQLIVSLESRKRVSAHTVPRAASTR